MIRKCTFFICIMLLEMIRPLSKRLTAHNKCVLLVWCVLGAFVHSSQRKERKEKKQSVCLLGDSQLWGLVLGDICCLLPPLCSSGRPTYLCSSLSATNILVLHATQSRCACEECGVKHLLMMDLCYIFNFSLVCGPIVMITSVHNKLIKPNQPINKDGRRLCFPTQGVREENR